MPRALMTADFAIELEVTVSGIYNPAEPDVGISDDQFIAEQVDDLFYRNPRTKLYTSILQGVDSDHPEVRKLLSNLLNLYDTEAAEALREANV